MCSFKEENKHWDCEDVWSLITFIISLKVIVSRCVSVFSQNGRKEQNQYRAQCQKTFDTINNFQFPLLKNSQQTKTKADAIIVGRELSWHWFMIEILSCFRLHIQVSDTMCKFSIWTNVVITYSIFVGYYKIAYGIPYIPEFSESKWPK